MELLHEAQEIIVQRYRIVDTLGQGGSGTTYLAEDLQSGQHVALKALSLCRMSDWKMMQLFEREARVLAQLNHPAIPRYLEYFHVDTPQDRSFYIAQQLAPGQSLALLVQKGWRTSEEEVRRIAIQILEILVYLHELTPSVIHRDIKPQNIIRHSDGQVFLVDFGAVQDTYYSTFMRGSTVVGTYGYMAPEQFRGQAVPATDLYGLGATLLFLLTHRSPTDLPTDRLKIDFRSRVQISEEFADWLEKMLEPDVEDRFGSAKEALAVLRSKRKVTTRSGSSVPWKALVGTGVATVAAVTVLNSFKYAVLCTFGLTPFIGYAIDAGYIDIRDYLSTSGDVNSKDLEGLTLLHKAAQKNEKDIVELLIAKGADVNARDNAGTTPLGIALRSSNMEVASLFIARGARFSNQERIAKDNQGTTLLHRAVQNKSKKLAELLIAQGADVKARDNNGSTPLHLAVPSNNKELAELLIAKRADVNARNNDGNTPLQLAFRGNHEVVLLIAKRVDVNARDNQGNTPLHMALVHNNKMARQVAKLLIAKGADVNARNNHGFTPLHMALQDNNEVAKLLIAKGANVNARDNQGGTPLHEALLYSNNEVAKLLIAKGADVNAKNNQGNTPLHWGNIKKGKEVVELLIAKGADVNARNNDGNTPLHLAFEVGKKEMAELLIAKGADVNAKNNDGYIPRNIPLHQC
jgi:ankyrin repeat protein